MKKDGRRRAGRCLDKIFGRRSRRKMKLAKRLALSLIFIGVTAFAVAAQEAVARLFLFLLM